MTLAAWLLGIKTSPLLIMFEIQMEPVVRQRERVAENTGRYYGHVWWAVPIDAIAPDIDITGYVTEHPASPQRSSAMTWAWTLKASISICPNQSQRRTP